MEDIKVKVNNEAESREVIFLGEQLGYARPHPPSHISMKNGGYVCLGFNYDGVQEDLILLVGGFKFKESDMNDIKDYKELTIPQLRDLVVLKRNDVGDATHTDQDNWRWYIGVDSYVWQAGNAQQLKQWDKSNLDHVDLKPIEKKMKEYLIPINGFYKYQKAYQLTAWKHWILIPDGAEWAKLWDEGDKYECIEFYRGKNEFFSAYNQEWMRGGDQKENKVGQPARIIWQRPTKPEALPFVDDEPNYTYEDIKYMNGCSIGKMQSLNAEIEQVRQDNVNHPNNYTQGGIECIDALEAATVSKKGIEAVCVANIIKYLWRYEEKNGLEDVKKARWYLDRLIKHLD